MMDKYRIPRHLDAPFKIIIWTADELIVFLVPFVLCMTMFNSPVIGVALGIGLVMLLNKLKGEEGQHFILHLMYWYLPPVIRYKATPPSYLRELLG
jgi:conjugal transfer pilus assembly protein TraL